MRRRRLGRDGRPAARTERARAETDARKADAAALAALVRAARLLFRLPAMRRPAHARPPASTTGCIILPASLFIGLMIAGPGTAVYPPVSTWAAPLICSGNVEVQSDYYSVRPGESGVSRTIYCVSGEGKAAPRSPGRRSESPS